MFNNMVLERIAMAQRKHETKAEYYRRKYLTYEKPRRQKNREVFNAQRRNHYQRNKERISENHRRHRYKDIEVYNAKERARHARNPDIYKNISRRHREKLGKEEYRRRARGWAAKQRAKGNHWKYIQLREQIDPAFLLSRRIRARINMAFRKARLGTRKADTTIKLLGCSYNEFKKHIESRFVDGMDWQAVLEGRIHIDHIKPVSSFDLIDPLQQKLAFHFSNCQPLWDVDNISKGNRVIVPFAA